MNAAAAGAALAATLLLVAAKAAPTAAIADYELEPAGSSLRFTAVQQGARFESRFDRFTAQVRFDPASPEAGSITSRIELGSVDTGNPERDEVLGGSDWFNLAKWPEALFTAGRIVRDGDGFRASGSLTLRGVTAPVSLRFRWTPGSPGQPARLVGAATVERLAFGVGQGEWRDTSYVGNRVDVQVDIRLRPISSSDKSVSIKGDSPDVR
ncbi:MAG: YceI family protein [Chromatiales bacterium]|nr:YceI family protein [Chromatiales bacterium]